MTRFLIAFSAACVIGAGSAQAQLLQGPRRNPALSEQDRGFLQKASQGGQEEVQMGQLAMTKSQNPAVKEFGRWMVTDHTAMNKWLLGLAARANVQPGAASDPAAQQEMAKLGGLQGAEFDREYIGYEVQDHQHDLKDFEAEAQSGQSPILRNFAAQSTDVLGQHLAEAQELQQSLGGGASTHAGP
jgi:putative membrane protein